MDRDAFATDGGNHLNLVPGSRIDDNPRYNKFLHLCAPFDNDHHKPLEQVVDVMFADASARSRLALDPSGSTTPSRAVSVRPCEMGRSVWAPMRRSA